MKEVKKPQKRRTKKTKIILQLHLGVVKEERWYGQVPMGREVQGMSHRTDTAQIILAMKSRRKNF